MSLRWLGRPFPLVVALLAGAGLTAACEPCSGVGACRAPRLSYEGRITRDFPDGPAEDVAVEFVRTGGARLPADTVYMRTDSTGAFRLEAPEVSDEVVGDLIVHAPAPGPALRVPGLRLSPSRAPGDRRNLGEWAVPYPYIGARVQLVYNTDSRPARGVAVEFRRTGGIPVEPGVLRDTSDSQGRFGLRLRTRVAGTVIGDLDVRPLPPSRPFTVTGIRLSTFVTERSDTVLWIGIGPYLPYSIVVVWDDTGQPIDGAQVEFRRTGGVPIYPTPFVGSSDQYGTVHLNPVPLAEGELIGDVIVRPPAPAAPFTFPDVRLATVTDQRAVMLLGFWRVPRR